MANKEETSSLSSSLFKCSSYNDFTTFEVAQFSGTDSISAPYRFDITLTSNDANIEGNSLINEKATLFLKRAGQYYPYSGIITSFKYVETTVDHSIYKVVLQPSLWLLSLTVQSRVFQKKSVPDIVDHILKDAGMSGYYQLDVQSYPEREYVVQYQESDINFISRLLEEAGIWYFFREMPLSSNALKDTRTQEELIITDKPSNFINIEYNSIVNYRSKSGVVDRNDGEDKETVYRLESNQEMIPEKVIVKNYNYHTPESDLELTSTIPGGNKGTVYRYGGNFRDFTGAQKAAEIVVNRYTMQKTILKGSADCSGFRAANYFTLDEHSRKSMNTSYLLTRVSHRGVSPSFAGLKVTTEYSNDFTCTPSSMISKFAPDIVTPVPKIPGIMTAMIEAKQSEYASLDDKGRYKVRMPFDRSDSENYDASKYIRLSQPYSGADYGIHFPSHEGAEMVVGHIDGDPDKPLGLGTVPHANTISPVKVSNQTTSIIRTAGKNEIIFDDTAGAEKISVYTPKDLNLTADNNETITVKNDSTRTVGGNASDSITGNSSVTVEGNSTESVSGNSSVTIGGTSSATITGDTTITVSNGNYALNVQTGNATCEVKGDVTETFQGARNTTVTNAINITSTGSSIHLSAATDIVLEVGLSRLALYKDGTILLTGNKITAAATDNIVLFGANLVKSTAKSIESEATEDHTIKGMMVSSSADSTNTVKGAVALLLNPD